MDRSLTIGATGGTFSAIALRLLADLTGAPQSSLPFPIDCPLCPDLPWFNFTFQLDCFSLLLGIVIGLGVGPLLDLCYIIRQSWRIWVRERLEYLARQAQGKYKLV